MGFGLKEAKLYQEKRGAIAPLFFLKTFKTSTKFLFNCDLLFTTFGLHKLQTNLFPLTEKPPLVNCFDISLLQLSQLGILSSW